MPGRQAAVLLSLACISTSPVDPAQGDHEMSRRFFRLAWSALLLLLVLPQLAAAQNHLVVRDDYTHEIVYPSVTVSVIEDITASFIAQRTYTISNVGSIPVSIGPCSIVSDDGSFHISQYPYYQPQTSSVINPGFAAPLAVQHYAQNVGTQNATVTCRGDIESIAIRIRGRVLDSNPNIVLETPKGKNIPKNGTFSFGSAQTGTPLDADFHLINLGNQPLTLSLSLNGSAYSVLTAPPSSLAKGADATFRLRFLSPSAGTFTGQLTLTSNDPDDNPYTVNLSGSASAVPAPQIKVTDNGNAGAVVAKGATINLGSLLPNSALNRTFTVTNTGNATLSITNPISFLSGAGFSIYSSAPNSLSPGSNGTFTVRFQAASAGSYSGTVSLASNDPDDNPFTFNLQATVTAAVPRIRIVDQTTGQTVAPGSTTISFGSPAPNTAVTHAFRIYNDGTASLALSNPASFVSGSGFTLSSPPPASIAAGGSAPFFINFQGSSAGSYSGTAALSHNDPTVASPLIFGLQATIPVAAIPVVTLTASDPEASETSGNGGQLTLSRSGSTATALTVNLNISGTATSGADYSPISTTQTFAAGQGTLTIPVTPIDDAAVEDVETVILTLSPNAAYANGSPSSGTVSIANNDFTPCTASATVLCLQGGRFEATLTAVANGAGYTGQSLSLGDASGGFWLFSPANIEIGVKVLDGASLNGKFWIYHGTATDLAYTLTVRDRANASQTRTFTRAAGGFCGGADTGFFTKSRLQPLDDTLELGGAPERRRLAASICAPDATTTCLLGSRFQVRVKRGTAYQQVIPVTSQTAFFSFFAPDNLEIFVKVLDGTTLNGKYWVYFGSMTDQTYTVEVTDTVTGLVKSYPSAGAFCGNADTSAF
jgi:hypothetical protein